MKGRIKQSDKYYDSGYYICTCDLDQITQYEIGGQKIDLLKERDNNHRTSHPNVGVITQAIGNTQFNVGDSIICHHFTFTGSDRKPKVFYRKDGVDYYKVSNREVFFKIENETLVPREGNLLCKAIFDKLLNTTLELSSGLLGNRRDTVIVDKVWEGCEEFKEGDYIMLQRGGDYELTFNGESYLKVDVYFKDVMAIVDSPDWRINEVLTHVTDHNTKVTI